MIKAMIDGLDRLCKYNSKVVILPVDGMEAFGELVIKYPGRVIDVGIAECNAINVAAGLSSCGYIPYVAGGNSFLAYRAYEFIRDQLCMQKRNVKVIGSGAGVAISALGNTQHATEDLSALRVLPNLSIITPSTPIEVKHVISHSINIENPLFIRIGRADGNDFYNEDVEFVPGKIQEIKRGKDIAVFSTGTIVSDALKAAEILEKKGMNIGIINVHTLKPLDREGIIELSKSYGKWISLEEHNIIGGLGSVLAELIVDERIKVNLKKIGLIETFAKGHGQYSDLKKVNGLGVDDIIKICMEVKNEK